MLLCIGGKISKENLQTILDRFPTNVTVNNFVEKYQPDTMLFLPLAHGAGFNMSIEDGKLHIFAEYEDCDLDFEEILEKNNVNYDRYSSANEPEELDSELVKFREGMKEPISCITDVCGNPVIAMSSIKECLGMANVKTMIQTIEAHLRSLYVPELEPLEII